VDFSIIDQCSCTWLPARSFSLTGEPSEVVGQSVQAILSEDESVKTRIPDLPQQSVPEES
jgi:hypothetical protein